MFSSLDIKEANCQVRCAVSVIAVVRRLSVIYHKNTWKTMSDCIQGSRKLRLWHSCRRGRNRHGGEGGKDVDAGGADVDAGGADVDAGVADMDAGVLLLKGSTDQGIEDFLGRPTGACFL